MKTVITDAVMRGNCNSVTAGNSDCDTVTSGHDDDADEDVDVGQILLMNLSLISLSDSCFQ